MNICLPLSILSIVVAVATLVFALTVNRRLVRRLRDAQLLLGLYEVQGGPR